MALIRCPECAREISDKATACPNCGAPVDVSAAVAAPEAVSYADGTFRGTPAMLLDLAKTAVGRVNYRLDSADVSAGTVSFTTGATMGSFSGVSGTVAWRETSPYRFEVTGQAKQNVRGGQVAAVNLFDEANAKVQRVIAEMQRLASGAPLQERREPAGALPRDVADQRKLGARGAEDVREELGGVVLRARHTRVGQAGRGIGEEGAAVAHSSSAASRARKRPRAR